jgi:hypothetical protein
VHQLGWYSTPSKNGIKSYRGRPLQSFTIYYLAEGATNASLLVVNSSSGASVINSSLDPMISSADIVTSNLSTGSYLVVLICDGQIADSANLQIQ